MSIVEDGETTVVEEPTFPWLFKKLAKSAAIMIFMFSPILVLGLVDRLCRKNSPIHDFFWVSHFFHVVFIAQLLFFAIGYFFLIFDAYGNRE